MINLSIRALVWLKKEPFKNKSEVNQVFVTIMQIDVKDQEQMDWSQAVTLFSCCIDYTMYKLLLNAFKYSFKLRDSLQEG